MKIDEQEDSSIDIEEDKQFNEDNKNQFLPNEISNLSAFVDKKIEYDNNNFCNNDKNSKRKAAYIILAIVACLIIFIYLTGFVLHCIGLPEYELLTDVFTFLTYIATTVIGYLFAINVNH